MGHDHLARLAHARRDRVPVVRGEGAQVEDLGVGCRRSRPAGPPTRERCTSAPKVTTVTSRALAHARAPCRRGSCSRGPGSAPCCRSGGRGACARGRARGRRQRIAVRSRPFASSAFEGITTRRPGDVGEEHLAALAVVDGAALEVAAVGHADHQRALEGAVRAPADQRQLVADLHVRRPDVVEELDLDHRLEAARGHPDGAADDVGLGERRVEDAVASRTCAAGCG